MANVLVILHEYVLIAMNMNIRVQQMDILLCKAVLQLLHLSIVFLYHYATLQWLLLHIYVIYI